MPVNPTLIDQPGGGGFPRPRIRLEIGLHEIIEGLGVTLRLPLGAGVCAILDKVKRLFRAGPGLVGCLTPTLPSVSRRVAPLRVRYWTRYEATPEGLSRMPKPFSASSQWNTSLELVGRLRLSTNLLVILAIAAPGSAGEAAGKHFPLLRVSAVYPGVNNNQLIRDVLALARKSR